MNTLTPFLKEAPQGANCVTQPAVQPLGHRIQPLLSMMPLSGGRKSKHGIHRDAVVSRKSSIRDGFQRRMSRTYFHAPMQNQAVMKPVEQYASWSQGMTLNGDDLNEIAVLQRREHARALGLKDNGCSAAQELRNKFFSGMLSRRTLTFHSIRKDR